MGRSGRKKGFTLVELSLSIAFIGILSITIALIINDAISTYRRGLTLNQINTVGMDLVDDMRVAIQNSPAKVVVGKCSEMYSDNNEEIKCTRDEARRFTVVERLAGVDGVKDSGVPVSGAFCTGKYSYVWNSGYFDVDKVKDEGGKAEAISVEYKDSEDKVKTLKDFRLAKIRDAERAVCMSGLKDDYDAEIGNVIKIDTDYSNVLEEPEVLLAKDSANPLALYDLVAMAPVSNGVNAAFYSVSFILGTVQGGINVMSSGNFCQAPNSGGDSNFDYCAINKFNFAAQANGG